MKIAEYIKSKVEVSTVFRVYSEVTGRGKQKFAHCPFHSDHTPSVSIRDDRGSWHCFSCGAKGDIISLVGTMEGLNFTESIEWIQDTFNIEPPERIYKDQLRAHIARLEKSGNKDQAMALLLGT